MVAPAEQPAGQPPADRPEDDPVSRLVALGEALVGPEQGPDLVRRTLARLGEQASYERMRQDLVRRYVRSADGRHAVGTPLSARQRAALVLGAQDGLAYAEVASVLHCPEPAVAEAVRRATASPVAPPVAVVRPPRREVRDAAVAGALAYQSATARRGAGWVLAVALLALLWSGLALAAGVTAPARQPPAATRQPDPTVTATTDPPYPIPDVAAQDEQLPAGLRRRDHVVADLEAPAVSGGQACQRPPGEARPLAARTWTFEADGSAAPLTGRLTVTGWAGQEAVRQLRAISAGTGSCRWLFPPQTLAWAEHPRSENLLSIGTDPRGVHVVSAVRLVGSRIVAGVGASVDETMAERVATILADTAAAQLRASPPPTAG